MKEKILALLKEAEDFLSGEIISDKLGVSRSAVWKHIGSLRAEGYKITSAPNKGYQLISSGNIINKNELADGLNTSLLGNTIVCMDTVDSTNNEAKRRADLPDGTLFITDVQSAGKGRRGRGWTAQSGAGIWMSLLLKPEIDMRDISQVTLVAGMGVCRALREVTGVNAQIKWPNDIVCNGKKICGILTEMVAEIDHVEYLVCGIGINVNQKAFDDTLAEKAISVRMLTGQKSERVPIVQSTLRYMEEYYSLFLEHGFAPMRNDYRAMCVTLGRQVKIVRGSLEQIAFARDVNDRGELLVDRDGRTVAVNSGEVSVRGVYGYI